MYDVMVMLLRMYSLFARTLTPTGKHRYKTGYTWGGCGG